MRSLRLARTLADRFRAALKPGMLSTTERELVFGEAQQTYPEIWRHLDEARTALLEQGRDVSAFDQLRLAELECLGVTEVTELETTAQLDYMALLMGRIRIHAVKAATFNTAGHQRAVAACRALMDAMPEVDWAGLVREEDREIAAAGSLHASTWSGTAKAIAMAVGLASVAGGVYFLATLAPAEPPPGAQPKHSPADDAREQAESIARRTERTAKLARIKELHAQYRVGCDPALLPVLAQAMRDVDHHTDAALVAAEACTPRRPPCSEVAAALRARLARQLQLDPFVMVMHCEGIVAVEATRLQPAFAVTIEDAGAVQRGVVSLDGTRDLVPFAQSPAGARLMKRGEIDADHTDELVFASERELFVTRIVDGTFVDVAGPKLGRACELEIAIERTYASDGNRLVLTSLDNKQGCLPEGRHRYALRDGALVEEKDEPISQ